MFGRVCLCVFGGCDEERISKEEDTPIFQGMVKFLRENKRRNYLILTAVHVVLLFFGRGDWDYPICVWCSKQISLIGHDS